MIHPTALVDPKAELAEDVEVGAFTIIDAKVRIDSGTRIGPHAVITGRTTIGKNNHIFQFTSIGEQPQDKKYAGEDTQLIIGDNNTIREMCTFSRGSAQGGGVTRIGSNNWIMACVHIAHDCILGDNIIMANNASLAGHVTVPHDLDPVTLEQSANNIAGHTNPANLLDISAGDRLTIGDNGQRLHERT